MDQEKESISSTEKNADTNGEPNTAPPIHRELVATCDKIVGSIAQMFTDDPTIFDGDLDLAMVDCNFKMFDGDKVRLIVSVAETPKVIRIEPYEELRAHTGTITQLTKSFGIIDDDIIYFVVNESMTANLKKNDQVECTIIEGDYIVGKSKYVYRCERLKKVDAQLRDLDMDRWFDAAPLETIEEDESEAENEDKAKMKFEAYKGKEPNEEYYDLPYGLFEILRSENLSKINRKLKQFVPKELNYSTYKKRFHAHVYLEEVEMQISFEKYKSREMWIEPDNKRFSILCSKITELRPPIAVGDRVHVYKNSNPSYYYRGTVERVREDRFILKFRDDFIKDFRLGEPFSAEFFHNRVVFQRKHAAIEYAKQKLSESFLFPEKFIPAKNLQLNAEIVDGKLHLNGEETPWFKELNEEQKEAVAVALRGESRPLPLVIYGPPGTGKTSTLIEIILQVYVHVPNSKILIATQSNHAANVVATRLISCKQDIGSNMLRLVSNSVLDRKGLPKELFKYSASVMHANAEQYDDGDEVAYEDIPKDVKRNCRLNYLKDFKIIIGTCVGLGILFNSEFSDKYFTHVFIDEAAQCSECEAMIPITSINPDGGQIILAGDPLQLPPISLSNHAKHYDLVKSMLQRYMDMYKVMDDINPTVAGGFDSRLVVKLRRNYRSIPSILDYYNKQFYGSALIPTVSGSESPEAVQLKSMARFLPQCADINGDEPFGITFVNVEGRNERLENKKSWENKEEAALIKSFVAKILSHKIQQEDIGVITPYHAQVMALKKSLKSMRKVRVGTVEEFQGEEKMVIVFSAVKTSGKEKALQFIFCPKRLNTAISRARMLVVIFGKASLLKADANWNELIEYCQNNNAFIEGKNIVQIL